ncbi:3572_t:CDS:1, partial [Entrophospora sp. SA101]
DIQYPLNTLIFPSIFISSTPHIFSSRHCKNFINFMPSSHHNIIERTPSSPPSRHHNIIKRILSASSRHRIIKGHPVKQEIFIIRGSDFSYTGLKSRHAIKNLKGTP